MVAFEAFDHPIYAMMFHPEYQLMEFLTEDTFNIVNNPDTRQIFVNFGEFIYNESIKNRILNKALNWSYNGP